ncbi:MAG: di-trans,poly-cis-decaprenylcistransferase [Candidatus Levybacteria bacterium]|nr:di-trans,poly-cis-decaprenylcistransferase [Candidatus Levybacteria bacterium]MBI2190159.1 di-trans,poly-cis-decaprenylcistransferase [Candidatus Levybacteria bacterium]MBI3070368.1 di-trans,poly-cis-decaprenylcistransferase [Candidatus Levybacteria bacterium]MBI3093196.1 di-trans,poly-cis-decaprenylcistransferase [Candidatus Levybacteria bacterium]
MTELLKPSPNIWERFPQLKEVPQDGFPNHVLIIPDGNRRFATASLQNALFGHEQGMKVVANILRDLRELPISTVTLWAFSADNWKRTSEEVNGLMLLLERGIKTHFDELMKNNVRVVHLGRKDRITKGLRATIEDTEVRTANNTGQTLCLAIDFGGRDQERRMLEAVRKISPDVQLTDELINKLRDGKGLVPPADLLVRTSERRTSDIGWLNGAQTELYFIDNKLFPEITTVDIVAAIYYFSTRQRRMGA